MKTRAPISESRRAESRRAEIRRAEIRRAEQVRVEGLRASQLRANHRRAVRLAATPGALAGIFAFLVVWAVASLVAGLVVGAVLALLAGVGTWMLAVPLVTRLAGATPAGPERQPRAHNLLDGLCPSAGVPKPDLWVLDTDVPNAMVAATHPGRARLILTSGLLSLLTRIELEGILAHELMHLRSGEVVPATLVAATGWPLLGRVPGRYQEEAADLAATSLTRYPPGLAAALEKMPDRLPVSGIGAKLTGHMWLVSPGAAPGPRAAALREL